MRTKYRDSFYQGVPSSEVINSKKKLIDRVTKLFALADGTNHTEEADAARKMAIKLLADHNISINQLSKDDEYVVITESFTTRRFNHTKFLYNAIAAFTGVRFLLYGKQQFRYIGTKSNIEAFRYMLCVVLEQRDRAYELQDKGDISTKQRWMLGFAYGVCDKCRQLKQQTAAEVVERGLVPVNESKQAENWYSNQGNKFEKASIETTKYSTAGREAGRNVNLNLGVGRSSSTKQIGA